MTFRERVLSRVEHSVARRGFPRVAVGLTVAFAALCGLAFSIVFLALGLTHMGVRYLVCLALGYLVFLVLLRLLAARHADHFDSGLDLLDLGTSGSDGSNGTPASETFSGGDGGEFGGGGASGSWTPEAGESGIHSVAEPLSSTPDAISGVDLDDGVIFVLPVAILAGAVFAGGYVIAIAPALLAEAVLDVALAAGAYRAARQLAPQHWAVGAVRRTWVVVLCLAILVGGLGFTLQAWVPGAHTIGDALFGLSRPAA